MSSEPQCPTSVVLLVKLEQTIFFNAICLFPFAMCHLAIGTFHILNSAWLRSILTITNEEKFGNY